MGLALRPKQGSLPAPRPGSGPGEHELIMASPNGGLG
jgi:hypothetical protein